MPEASIDEHGHSCGTEHQVRAAPECRERLCVNSVPETPGVKKAAESQLRSGVPRLLPLHSRSNTCVAGPRQGLRIASDSD
jgi:hypothetical protein